MSMNLVLKVNNEEIDLPQTTTKETNKILGTNVDNLQVNGFSTPFLQTQEVIWNTFFLFLNVLKTRYCSCYLFKNEETKIIFCEKSQTENSFEVNRRLAICRRAVFFISNN